MQSNDLIYRQKQEAHKYTSTNQYPPFKWQVDSNHMETKNGIPQGNIRYSFYDDDNNLKYEGDIRIIECEDGLVRQDIDFKLVDGQYEDVVNSFNIYRLYSTQIAIGYWVCDNYQHINIICLRGYGEKADIRARLAARYWKKILGIDATPGKFLGEDVLEVKFNMPEPYFYPTDDIPILQEIKANFPQIKKEILEMIEAINWEDFPKYEAQYHPKYGGSLYENDWKVIPLSSFKGIYGVEKYAKGEAEKLFQKVKKLIPTYRSIIKKGEKEGWIANSFLSKLVPGSIINPHKSWTEDYLRAHICITEDKDCIISKFHPDTPEIKESRTWKEGELLAFHDGGNYLHAVKHKGKKPRIIISLDLKIDHIFDGHYLKYANLPIRPSKFKFTTTIIKGVQIDSIIGLPSANLKEQPDLRCGIYTVDTNFGKGVLNNYDIKSTVHILDFDKEIYGEKITITNPQLIDKKHKFANPLFDFYNEFCDKCE